MVIRQIYDCALRILAESTVALDNSDYEERAPYLVASFCTQLADVDAAIRKALDKEQTKQFNAVYISLDDEFPLLDRLSASAALYLAAMLVIDDNTTLSDKLYDKYCDAISRIQDSVPALTESISNRYFFS